MTYFIRPKGTKSVELEQLLNSNRDYTVKYKISNNSEIIEFTAQNDFCTVIFTNLNNNDYKVNIPEGAEYLLEDYGVDVYDLVQEVCEDMDYMFVNELNTYFDDNDFAFDIAAIHKN